MQAASEISIPLGIVWGADAIARTIGLERRATYHALENGQVPGARRIGGKWALDPHEFRRAFSTQGVAA